MWWIIIIRKTTTRRSKDFVWFFADVDTILTGSKWKLPKICSAFHQSFMLICYICTMISKWIIYNQTMTKHDKRCTKSGRIVLRLQNIWNNNTNEINLLTEYFFSSYLLYLTSLFLYQRRPTNWLFHLLRYRWNSRLHRK